MDVAVKTSAETKDLGAKLGRLLQPGDVISLHGPLGAGKTYFTKGLGRGLGIPEKAITSPTFKLINQYGGTLPVYHFDVYRLTPQEFADLGYEDFFYGQGVTVIEWGDLVGEYLPEDYLEVQLVPNGDLAADTGRSLTFIAHGPRSQRLVEDLKRAVAP